MTFASRTISAVVKFGGVRYCVSGLAANDASGVANRLPRGNDKRAALTGGPAQRLVIEVDGAYHGEHGPADARRDAVLKRAGYRVVRVEASLVVSDIEQALRLIEAALGV